MAPDKEITLELAEKALKEFIDTNTKKSSQLKIFKQRLQVILISN